MTPKPTEVPIAPEVSEKLRILNPALIVLVVLIHAATLDPLPEQIAQPHFPAVRLAALIEDFLSHGLARVAVPLFFVISGYLFFHRYDGSWTATKAKWRTRVRSLVIPYFLWAALWFVVLRLARFIPAIGDTMDDGPDSNTPLRILERLTLYPYAAPLWFVRELIFLVAISPLIHAIRSIFLPLVIATGLAWFALPREAIWIPGLLEGGKDFVVLHWEGIFFFFLGGYLGHRKIDLRLPLPSAAVLMPIWVTTLVVRMVMDLQGIPSYWLLQISILVGIAAFWRLYDAISPVYRRIEFEASIAFFVFAAHRPILTAIQTLLHGTHPKTTPQALLVYLVGFALIMPICMALGHLVRRVAPRPFAALTGGR